MREVGHYAEISIPYGAIKSKYAAFEHFYDIKFQFLMVRLKETYF